MKNAPTPPPAPPVDDPHELPYPGYAREKAALDAKVAAANRAHAEPLPGPLAAAYAGEPVSLHGFTLQPVLMGLITVLKRIHSPLLDVVRILREELTAEAGEDSAPAAHEERVARAHRRMASEITASDEEFAETIFVFVRPLNLVCRLLDTGRDRLRAAAVAEILNVLTPVQFSELQKAVAAHYAASFATVVQYAAPSAKDDGGFFTAPPAGPMMTASAGGSPSSVC